MHDFCYILLLLQAPQSSQQSKPNDRPCAKCVMSLKEQALNCLNLTKMPE